VHKKISDTIGDELAQEKAKLIMVRDLLAKKNARIDQLEADVDELRSSIPPDKLNQNQQHTLADSIQRYRNRFDDTKESRITRKPRKVKVYYNGKSMMLDAYMGSQDLPAQLRSPVRANTRAACKGQLMREIREVIIVQANNPQQHWVRLQEGDIIAWEFDVEEPTLAVEFAVKKRVIQGAADEDGIDVIAGIKADNKETASLHGSGEGPDVGMLLEVPWNGMQVYAEHRSVEAYMMYAHICSPMFCRMYLFRIFSCHQQHHSTQIRKIIVTL
jgi:hypothetical protein